MAMNLLKTLVAAIILFICFSACKKESMNTSQTQKINSDNSTASKAAATFISCNILVNVFDPSPTASFTLGMSFGSSYLRFGIPVSGTLDFVNTDKVKFEFSGAYADRANTVKLYYIRRTDGLYFTWGFGIVYTTKFTYPANLQNQRWIINNLGGNKYNLIAYTAIGCIMARTYPYNGTYKIGTISSDQNPSPGSTTIYILPEDFILPPTK